MYRVFIKYCVFSLKFWIFLNSASSAASAGFPCICTHTDIEGEQRKARVRNILKSSGKNTIFNEHPVVICIHKNYCYFFVSGSTPLELNKDVVHFSTKEYLNSYYTIFIATSHSTQICNKDSLTCYLKEIIQLSNVNVICSKKKKSLYL